VVTATVVVDLASADRDRMRNRLSTLPDCPDGARVVVQVGAIAPEPEATRLLAEHERRLVIDIHGTPFAVRRWVESVRSSFGEVLL
jgi:hypothetical protein